MAEGRLRDLEERKDLEYRTKNLQFREKQLRENGSKHRKRQSLRRAARSKEQEIARQQYEIEQQRIQQVQRQRENERQEQLRWERQKRLEEQELKQEEHAWEQLLIEMDQDFERQIAEEKAREAFVCRRCPAKFSSNTQLHIHISAQHSKPTKAAPAMAISSSSAPLSRPATPSPSSTPATTSKPSYADLARRTPPTPPSATSSTTPLKPNYAKMAGKATSTPCTPTTTPSTPAPPIPWHTKPNRAKYMTMEDLFRKFAGKTPTQSLPTMIPSPSSTGSSRVTTTSHSFPSPIHLPTKQTSFVRPIQYTCSQNVLRHNYLANPVWEWTRQVGLRVRAWV